MVKDLMLIIDNKVISIKKMESQKEAYQVFKGDRDTAGGYICRTKEELIEFVSRLVRKELM